MNYLVVILDKKTKEVVKEMGPCDYARAVKIETGANINLDHKGYVTEIRKAANDRKT